MERVGTWRGREMEVEKFVAAKDVGVGERKKQPKE